MKPTIGNGQFLFRRPEPPGGGLVADLDQLTLNYRHKSILKSEPPDSENGVFS
jgi:hypothetical protein